MPFRSIQIQSHSSPCHSLAASTSIHRPNPIPDSLGDPLTIRIHPILPVLAAFALMGVATSALADPIPDPARGPADAWADGTGPASAVEDEARAFRESIRALSGEHARALRGIAADSFGPDHDSNATAARVNATMADGADDLNATYQASKATMDDVFAGHRERVMDGIRARMAEI